jgi:protein tyrosine/serine phosphatase
MRFATLAAGIVCLAAAAPSRAELAVVEVVPGIYRGPAPETPADFRKLRDLGVRTVLDVRKFRRRRMDETCRSARAYGMNYLRLPVAFRPQRDGSAERALRALVNSCRHPIYLHCELGRDRSGLVVALYRVRCQGWSLQAAYCEMKRLGFSDRLPGLERYFWDYARRGP